MYTDKGDKNDKYNKDNLTNPTSSIRNNLHGKTVKSVKIPILSTFNDKFNSKNNINEELNNGHLVTRNTEKRKTEIESHKNIQSADKIMKKYATSKSTLNLANTNNNFSKNDSTNLTSRSKFINSQNTTDKEVKEVKDKVKLLQSSKSLKK